MNLGHVFMLKKAIKYLEDARWMRWIGGGMLLMVLLMAIRNGETWQGIGIVLVFGSAFVGSALPRGLARICQKAFPIADKAKLNRVSEAFAAFGFLFMPVPVGAWASSNLGLKFEMASLEAHFFWASLVAGVVYWINPLRH